MSGMYFLEIGFERSVLVCSSLVIIFMALKNMLKPPISALSTSKAKSHVPPVGKWRNEPLHLFSTVILSINKLPFFKNIVSLH